MHPTGLKQRHQLGMGILRESESDPDRAVQTAPPTSLAAAVVPRRAPA